MPLQGVTHHPEEIGDGNPRILKGVANADGDAKVQEVGDVPKLAAKQPTDGEIQVFHDGGVLLAMGHQADEILFVRTKLAKEGAEQTVVQGTVRIVFGIGFQMVRAMHARPGLGINPRKPYAGMNHKLSQPRS